MGMLIVAAVVAVVEVVVCAYVCSSHSHDGNKHNSNMNKDVRTKHYKYYSVMRWGLVSCDIA